MTVSISDMCYLNRNPQHCLDRLYYVYDMLKKRNRLHTILCNPIPFVQPYGVKNYFHFWPILFKKQICICHHSS